MADVYVGVMEEVAQAVADKSKAVRGMVVDKLVEREIARRAECLDKGLQKRKELFTELKKVDKPDVEHFDANGVSSGGMYTKERREAIAAAKQKLEKLDVALVQAIENNAWEKLSEMTK